ncbi:hypothetical protein QTN47_27330 [Danxiaibacter flavus]|uniref:Uncharacterized protein n=1 Tax=Danxiaibacter flavus TaxID=3049108 RepID=A0ABV3ZN56_9BACT|nr:hypothetical protein QNM32_27330 [Chitinophagaceae bacterium DXS]
MKQKLLAQLIVKYPGVSRIFLGLYADKLSAKVTEESQIQGVIDELENLPISIPDLAAEFQKEGDRRVTEAQKKAAEKKPGEGGKTEEDKTDPKTDDTATLLKTLLQEVQTLKADKAKTSMQTKAAEKLKDIPARFYDKRALPEKDEDLEAFVQEVNDDYNAFRQEMVDKGLAINTPPAGGKSAASATTVDPDIVAFGKKQSESVKK